LEDPNVVKKFRTEDGYIFYMLSDGSLVDNLDPQRRDMTYSSLEDLKDAVDVVEITGS
jgi:hypothetical protein